MVVFKDLTLREGSQVPGLEISEQQGRAVVENLHRMGVDYAELSFPRAHRRESWYRRADELGMRTAALARAVPDDVDAALAVDPDEVEVIVTSSDVQLEHALGKTRADALDLLVENVRRASGAAVDVGVTLMDAIRADDAYLRDCARAAVDAGAGHVTLADTTGAGMLESVRETVTAVVDEVGDDADVGIHTHDDMGIATANAAVAVAAGATRVDVTVGGIGERAGNAPLEEVAVLFSERGTDVPLSLEEVVPVCRRIHDVLGVEVPPRKPVIGDRAYRHESGLHTAAMLREPATYEAFPPDEYGGRRELRFGDETGRGAVRALLEAADVHPTDERVAATLESVRTAAAEKGEPLTEEEAYAVVRDRDLPS